MVEPLFSPEASQKPSASPKVSPIFGPEDSVPPPSKVTPQPLFSADEAPAARPATPAKAPEPLFAPEAAPPTPKKPVAPTVAFVPERDPVVESWLRKVLEAYPQEQKHEAVYRACLEAVIPTTQERILLWGERTVQVSQGAIAKAQGIVQQWAQLPVQETLQSTMAAA